jgi:hypothetical protein
LTVFLAGLALLLLLRQTVREVFIIPVLYLAWLGIRIFRGIHQAVFWMLLFLVAAVLLFSSLRKRPQPRPAVTLAPKRREISRRVAHWARLVKRTAGAADTAEARPRASQDVFALRSFARLIVSVLAYRAHVSPAELERDIRVGVLEPPADLRFYLDFSNGSTSGEPGRTATLRGTVRGAALGLKSALRRLRSRPPLSSDLHLQALIRSLETEWEDERDY